MFATDLDEQAIAIAREGFYTEADVADVSEERLQRFFQRETGGYRVRRELREMVLFAHHNVIKDPPFSHLDLDLLPQPADLPEPGGAGAGDRDVSFRAAPRRLPVPRHVRRSPTARRDLFVPVDEASHIYESRTVTTPARRSPSRTRSIPCHGSSRAWRSGGRRGRDSSPVDLHQRLLEQYAPPSLVVTEDHTIVHMSERAARYLQMPRRRAVARRAAS